MMRPQRPHVAALPPKAAAATHTRPPTVSGHHVRMCTPFPDEDPALAFVLGVILDIGEALSCDDTSPAIDGDDSSPPQRSAAARDEETHSSRGMTNRHKRPLGFRLP